MTWQLALIRSDMTWPEAVVTVGPMACMAAVIIAIVIADRRRR